MTACVAVVARPCGGKVRDMSDEGTGSRGVSSQELRDAEREVRESQARIEELGDADDIDSVRDRALAQRRLGNALESLGRFDEALDPLGVAYSTLADLPEWSWVAPSVAMSRSMALMKLERLDEALDWADLALAAARAASESPRSRDDLPLTHSWRLMVAGRVGRRDDALVAMTESAIAEVEPAKSELERRVVVKAVVLQAQVALSHGDYVTALAKFRQARTRFGPGDDVTSAVCEVLVGEGALLERLGERGAALKAYKRVLDIARRFPDADEPEFGEAFASAEAGKRRLTTRRWPLARRS